MILDKKIDKDYLLQVTKDLLAIDSPVGYHHEVMDKVLELVKPFGHKVEMNNKGGAIITVEGESNDKVIGLSVHVDTLGTMVRSITPHGTLKFVTLGGVLCPSLDSEFCTIRTRQGKLYGGTFLSTSPAAHVYADARTLPRDEKHMEVRIDEVVKSKEDVEALGIRPGDFIFIDPRTTITDSGFIKSRFIDDKACVGIVFAILELMHRENLKPKFTTKIVISNYEEIGHGAAYIPDDITEMIALDMGCVGDDLSGNEYDVSICCRDGSGPYDHDMINNLVDLAEANGVGYVTDVFHFYSSDASAALRGGKNIRGVVVGPGVHASHGMERTHYQGIENTTNLLLLYLFQ